jgi:hypothetical protein
VVPVVTPAPTLTPTPEPVATPRLQPDPLPAFAASIPGPDGLRLDWNVVATNILLTLLVILLFGLTSAVFNSTIDDNRDDISAAFAKLAGSLWFIAGPLGRLDRAAKAATERAGLSTAARVVIVLLVTGLIYGFLSPDFGLNMPSLFLFIALVVGLGFGTYLQEGGSTILAIRRYHVDSSVRLFGAGIAVAIACVFASRVAGLQPGFVYGFIASSVILAPVALDRRASATLVILPSIALLVASLLAWLAIGPLHQATEQDGSWFNVLADTVAVSIFVGGLEGVFYSMIPLTFMDGVVVWRWSRAAWVLIFGVTTFLFWQLVINQYAAYLDAFRQPTILAIIAILLVYGTLTIATWAFFKHRKRNEGGGQSGGSDASMSLREAVQDASAQV